MDKIKFEIQINATPEKVWEVLWNDESYAVWTSVFGGSGRAVSDWQEGSRIFFLASDDSGMIAEIFKKIPNQYMSFRHLGTVENGIENMESDEAREWHNARENYTLEPKAGGTLLRMDMDIVEKYVADFNQSWPAALQKVKELAEKP